jgi:hypothetical protein
LISIALCHNSGANTTHTELKKVFKITTELYLATDTEDFFIFKNRCTIVVMGRFSASAKTQSCTGPDGSIGNWKTIAMA